MHTKHVIGMNVFPVAWLLIAPFALTHLTNSHVVWNEVTTALIVVACSIGLMSRLGHQEVFRIGGIIAGAWLIVSPMLLGYPAGRSGADMLLGGLIVFITVMETLQATHHGLD